MLDNIILLIGITGVLAIASNFMLEVTNKLNKDHHLFAIINFYGSFALMTYSIYFKVWLFVVLNGFLVLVGLYGLNEAFKKRRRK